MRGTKMVWMTTMGAAMAATPMVIAQDDISFAPKFFEGQQFTYQMGMRLGISQTTGDAEASDAQIISTATCNFTINEVNSDGSARATMNVEQVDLEGTNGGQTIGYSWPMAFGAEGDAAAIQRLGEILSNSRFDIFIASNGNVSVEGGFDAFVSAAQDAAGTDSRLLGFFNPETFGATMTPIFTCDGARAKSRDQGDTWSATDLIPIAPIGLMDLDSTFTFIDFANDQASYSGMTTFSFHASGRSSGAMANIEIIEQSGVTKATFDTNQGLMSNRTSNTMIRSKWTLGDVSMEQTQDSTVTFVLVEAN